MTWAAIQLVLGIFLLFGGGDWLVEGAVALARRLGVPPLVVGLTIVGFGTSAPELLVSVVAAWKGSPEIALGNVVGSNIANVGLVLGLTGILAPIPFAGRGLGLNWLAMMAASAALAGVSWWAGGLARGVGLVFLAGLALFLAMSFFAGRSAGADDGGKPPRFGLWTALAVTLAGCGAVALGADFLVDGASFLAARWGVPQRVIGLTIVAVGTSLPELATSLMAALKKQMDISVGNIVGSNIFNILGILGVASSICPMPGDMPFADYGRDLAVMLAFALALGLPLAVSAFSKRAATLPRLLAAVLLLAYAGYAASLF